MFVGLALVFSGCPEPKIKGGDPTKAAPGLPELPWPPPKYSAFAQIPRELLVDAASGKTLQDVAHRLESAFEASGYVERSYYSVPGGFALVSRLEQMNADGTPKNLPDRWSVKTPPLRRINLGDYLQALFTARSGYYRVIVFVVTDQTFAAGARSPTGDEVTKWVSAGGVRLPASIGQKPYGENFATSALIYEFARGPEDAVFSQKMPSDFPGKTHLEKAKLWQSFQSP
jgi:hypothetical protein